MSTTAIPDKETRKRLADEGQELIETLVNRMDLPHIAEQMRSLETYNHANEEKISPGCPVHSGKNFRK